MTSQRDRCADENDNHRAALAAAITRELRESSYVAIREVTCDHIGGQIVLRGTLRTFHERQVALHVAIEIAGPQQIDDRIVVDWPPLGPRGGR